MGGLGRLRLAHTGDGTGRDGDGTGTGRDGPGTGRGRDGDGSGTGGGRAPERGERYGPEILIRGVATGMMGPTSGHITDK